MNQINVQLKTNSTLVYYSYPDYMDLMAQFVKLEITSGLILNAKLIETTKLNFSRMKRLNKTIPLPSNYDEIIKNSEQQEWIVISEAWCGDSAQNLPGIAKFAENSKGKIKLRIAFRDNNPALIENYLTNGNKAIPKLIARNSEGNDLFTWGPRPQKAIDIVEKWKANQQETTKEQMLINLYNWYNQDSCSNLFEELELLIKKNKVILS